MENEVRLIDGLALAKAVEDLTVMANGKAVKWESARKAVLKLIEEQPEISQERKRKTGKWINERILVGGFSEVWAVDCSVCGYTVKDKVHPYCPKCGSMME